MTKKEITQLSYEITGFAIKVHKILGPGLLESVYEECLKIELIKNGYDVKQQLIASINYEGIEIETKLIVDLLVNNRIKSCRATIAHPRSSTTYLYESS